jgi:hypothetical protein
MCKGVKVNLKVAAGNRREKKGKVLVQGIALSGRIGKTFRLTALQNGYFSLFSCYLCSFEASEGINISVVAY